MFDSFFFGVIADYKGLDQLLEASQQLRESGVENFDVEIAGSCYDWEGDYASKIRIPDMFKLRIGMVPNADLPDLFESAHWLVLPYRDATQSGPLSLAMRYNKPAIASNLPAFQEFLKEGQTGLIFQSGDVAGLREEMRKAVLMGSSGYDRLCTALAEDVESRYSLRAVAASFAEMFREFAKQSPKR
ncbi:MAG: glycosyltransferase [Fibrobacteres bacterium]|nr:glycosyltransferase [Fibrobacterota bacterium]